MHVVPHHRLAALEAVVESRVSAGAMATGTTARSVMVGYGKRHATLRWCFFGCLDSLDGFLPGLHR
jgi:hypothetical protein